MSKSKEILFITEICEIDKTPTPRFELLTDAEIFDIYYLIIRKLTDKLLWSRNIPIEKEYLDSLYKLTYTPKAIAFILNSMI